MLLYLSSDHLLLRGGDERKKVRGAGKCVRVPGETTQKTFFSAWALPRAMKLLPLALVLLRRTPRAPGIGLRLGGGGEGWPILAS